MSIDDEEAEPDAALGASALLEPTGVAAALAAAELLVLQASAGVREP